MEIMSEPERYESGNLPHDLDLSSEENHLIRVIVDNITSENSES